MANQLNEPLVAGQPLDEQSSGETQDDGDKTDNSSYNLSLDTVNSNMQIKYERVTVSTNHPNLSSSNIQIAPKAHLQATSIADNLLVLGTPSKPASYTVLTPRGAAMYLQDKFQAGSIKGSVFTLIICIVGAGALSLPWAFRVSGLVLGTLLLLLASGFTFLSLHFLVYAGLYIHETPSFRNLALKAGGKHLATYTSLNLMCNLFGTTVSYFVALGGILDLVYSVVLNTDKSIYKELVFGVAAFVVFPLSLMRSMNSLRYGSLIGITCSGYLCVVLVINYFRLCDDNTVFEDDPVERHTCFWKDNFSLSKDDLFRFTPNGFLSSFPIFCFAYSCQPNLLPIYAELQRRSVRRMHKVIRRALYFAVVLYICVGIFGYLTFMDGACGNILQNDFKKHPEMIVSAVTICISCTFTLPMCIYAFRQNLTVFTINKTEVHWIPHTLITLGMVAFCAIIAAEVSQLNVVLGFLGCTTNPSVAYFLPNLFFIKLVPRHKAPKRHCLAIASMVLLLALSAASFVFQIMALFDTSLNPASECAEAQHIEQ